MTSIQDTNAIVQYVLEQEKEKQKSIEVEKHLPLFFDLGTLLATDPDQIDSHKLKKDKEGFLLNLARDNTQLLINKIWALPITKTADASLVNLPKPQYRLPREKRLFKPKPPTKWERFAEMKGISKTKKAKLVWDDILKKNVPLYGYKRRDAEKQRDWCVPVPGNADPMEDQFAKKNAIRSEKVSKNEFQRLRNIAASKKIKIPRAISAPGSAEIKTKIAIARVSTASAGKFQPELKNEKRRRNALPKKSLEPMMPRSSKKPLKSFAPGEEKKNNVELAKEMLKKRPKFAVEKAVNRQMNQDERQRQEEKQNKTGKKGKKKGGSNIKKGSKGRKGGKKNKSDIGGGAKGKKSTMGRKKGK